MDKTIQVGSRAFFSQYEDFQPNDNDQIIIHDEADADFWITDEDGIHTFHYRNMTKDEFIEYELKRAKKYALVSAKFVVPEVLEHFQMNLYETYELFIQFINSMDRKHQYVSFIFNCYLKNRDIKLTEEQRLAAYEMYKAVR